MVCNRWGKIVTVVRLATQADAERLSPPWDDEAKINLANRSWALIRDERGNEEVSHLAHLRCDDWKEVEAALGPTWLCPDCQQAWPMDETCHNAKCLKTQQQRVKRWRAKQLA